jgi:AcrR family transcriptional regulator
MSPHPATSDQRRTQILDAASTIFARRGFHQARMEDIAAELGLSKPALYLYFDSKDAIVAALMRRLFDLELADLRALEAAAGTVQARLPTFHQIILRQYESMALHTPLMWEFYALAMRDDGVRRAVRDYLRAIRGRLEALIQQGVDRGELSPVDPRAPAIAILAVYEGLAVLCMTDPRAIKWKEQADEAVRLLLTGLTRGPSTV